jgi:hypothetical protein
MKHRFISWLKTKLYYLEAYIQFVLLPSQLRKGLSQRLLKKFCDLYASHVKMVGIALYAHKASKTVLIGDKKNLRPNLFGSTRLYLVATITLNFKSMANSLDSFTRRKGLHDMRVGDLIWITLIHECAHAAAQRVPKGTDHGLPFYYRLIKVHLWALYECNFGKLKKRKKYNG